MSPANRLLLSPVVAAVALAAGAAPALAGEVIVVDDGRATRVEDPLVPASWKSDLIAPAVGVASARRPSRGRRAIRRALRKARRKGKLSSSRARRYRRIYGRARKVRRRLRGARGRQLGYLIASLERIALRRRLGVTRMRPLFVQLQRNTRYWPRMPYPGSGQDVTFGRSELLYRYFPGRGLQLHPLGTFRKANQMYGACEGAIDAPCREDRLARLLDEMSKMAVRRHRRFIAWEYQFDFGGGAPPWISAMAQATGIQALGRAAKLLDRPQYVTTARRGLGAFAVRAPRGVRARGFRGGTHYLQYSYARRLYIFNAFVQALIGLRDFGVDANNARAMRLFERAEPELRRELPASDLGDWSLYAYRGATSTAEYHELLRELLQSACRRDFGELYCTYAKRYRRYQTEPPKIEITGPAATTEERATRVRFRLSKLSAVELQVFKNGKRTHNRLATFRRGRGSFLWTPRSPGTFTVRLGAKELRTGRGLRGRDSTTVEVENDPDA